MESIRSLIFLCFLGSIDQNGALFTSSIRKFPRRFMFGASTSAYQVEGGCCVEGKGPSIWDIAIHKFPEKVKSRSNGDIAADSYHFYKRDVDIAVELGLHFYKFSISWPRILPEGYSYKINDAGIEYYRDLITNLVDNKIKPFVCMYHWDLPAALQHLGGWTNPNIVDWFVDYAKVLFENFGDLVRHWITVSEPKEICRDGYGLGIKAPLRSSPLGEYLCMKNVLMAHASVYRLYDVSYRKIQKGKIGISIGFTWYEPYSETGEDKQAAADARQFDWGMYAKPIFSRSGDFPTDIKSRIDYKSYEQGFPRSRLPLLSPTEVNHIRGTSDFLGLSSFKSVIAFRDHISTGQVSCNDIDVSLVEYENDSLSHNLLQEIPLHFFKTLKEVRKLYQNPPVYIFDQNWSSASSRLDDTRIGYCRGYLEAVLNALHEDCDILGYSVWSLIDTFEWMNGYTKKYGLYAVDFASVGRKRTPRKSALVYKNIAKTRTLDLNYEPELVLDTEKTDTEKEVNDVF